MKETKSESAEKSPIDDSKQVSKKWCSKKFYNDLLNIISNFINNYNPFDEELTSNDLELKLKTDSNISRFDQIKYKIEINNISFNPKRDIVKNLDKYNSLPSCLEIKDEYSKEKLLMTNLEINLTPRMNKNMNFDMTIFPFYYYNKEKNSQEKYNIKLNDKNKFILCIYLSQFKKETKAIILREIEYIVANENIIPHIEKIIVILQVKQKYEASKMAQDGELNELLQKGNNENNNNKEGNCEKNKIKVIFNIASEYNKESVINIFKEQTGLGKDYFFLLGNNNKIVLIHNDLDSIFIKMNQFTIKLKKLIKEGKTYEDYIKEKELKKKEKVNSIKEILNFISKLKKLNYVYEFGFKISFKASINEGCSSINITNLNSIDISGKLRTQEFKYLQKLLKIFKNSKQVIFSEMKEMPTMDLDVDFTDMKCLKCAKLIPEDKHFYYCYICKTKYCYECVKEQLKKNGKEKYIDQKHNLLFFKTRNKKNFMNLDKPKLGNNRFAESTNISQFKGRHSATCNGCKSVINNMGRYVCIHCRPGLYLSGGYIDYCEECIEKMCNNKQSQTELEIEAEQTIYCVKNLFCEGHKLLNKHDHDNHLYLLLPLEYDCVSYPYNNY